MAERLTVLQVLPALESGGVERGTLEVGAELARRGHRSLVMSEGGRLVERLRAEGSEHFAWPIGRKSLWTLRLVPRLRRFLLEQGVDILHARSRLPAWIAWLAWRGMDPAARPRFVTTVHGLYSVGRYSAVMTRGERVIAVSRTVRDYILQNYPGVDEARIRVIPRGVDETEFPRGYRPSPEWLEAWYRQYPELEGRPVLTLPGRLSRLKGHEDFIGLLAGLKARGLDVRGLVVGGEEPRRAAYAEGLRRMAAEAGLDNVVFTGHRSDMREIYAVSDLVLSLSSKPESFGRTVLEALSLGTPVVGYDHGGVGEILAAAYPPGLCEPGDRAGLEAKVAALLDAPVPVPPLQGFSLRDMLDDTIRLYEELR